MRRARFALLALWATVAAAQTTGPQIPLTGSVGVKGSVAILGSASVTIADANHTLSANEYASNFLSVTSSVSLTAMRLLIAPLNKGQQFTIQNSTTGGQAIEIIGATGLGVVIPNGQTLTVACDGSNYLTAFTSSPSFNGVGYSVPDFNWQQMPGGTLSSGSNTITLVPCPRGVDTTNNTAAPYGVYISGGTGTAEAAPVTGGTCTPGASSGTIVVTAANSHSGAWTVGSANGGIQEAINTADGGNSVNSGSGYPFTRLQMVPTSGGISPTYNVYWTIFFNTGKSLLDGYGAFLACYTRVVCLMSNSYNNTASGAQTIQGLTFIPELNIDGAHIASAAATTSAGVSTYTITTSTVHNLIVGDYAIVSYSTPAASQEGRFLVASVIDSTHFTYQLPGSVSFSTSSGFGWVGVENAALEDESNELTMRDIKIQGNGAGPRWNQGVVVGNDQLFKIDHLTNLGSGTVLQNTANFTGNLIYLRGDQGAAPVGIISDLNASLQCNGNAIRDWAGNGLIIDGGVIEGWSQYAVFYANGLQGLQINAVYNESAYCQNKAYSGTIDSNADYISNGETLTVNGTLPIGGLYPQFDCTGNTGGTCYLTCTTTQRNYYIVPNETAYGGPGPALFAGSACPATNSENITVQWPNPDLYLSTGRTFDVLLTTGTSQAASPNGTGNYALATGISGSCSTAGICSFTDTQAAPSSYTFSLLQWNPSLYFWPGSIILGKGAKLYIDEAGMANGLVSTSLLPRIFAKHCVPGNNYTYSPSWILCPAGDASTPLIGAQMLPIEPSSGASTSNISGGLIFAPTQASSIVPREIITLMDGVPRLTISTPGYVRPASPLDDFIGTSSTASVGSQNQVYGSPIGHFFYVNDASFDSNWLEGLTASQKTFNVPAVFAKNVSILGTCLIGCGPFVPGGSQASDALTTNGSLNGNWTVCSACGSWIITSNQAEGTAGASGYALAAYTGLTFSNNQSASSQVAAFGGGIGPGVRMSSTTNSGYFVGVGPSSVELFKLVAGTPTLLGTIYSGTVSIGDTIGITVNGTSLTALLNGTAVATATDSAFSSGYPGIVSAGTPGGIVSFQAGDLTYTSPDLTLFTSGLQITSGATATIQSGGSLVCAIGATCPGGVAGSPILLPSSVTTLNADGDSECAAGLTAGFASGPASQMSVFPGIVAAVLHLTPGSNTCVAGTGIATITLRAMTVTPSTTAASIAMLGQVNVGGLGTSCTGGSYTCAQWTGATQAYAIWKAAPTDSMELASAATYSGGGWTNASVQAGAPNIYTSSTSGNTATFSVSGTAIYVGFYASTSATTNCNVTIGGVSQGTTTWTAFNGAGAMYVTRFSPFSSGTHSVVLSPTGSGQCSFAYVAGNGGTQKPFSIILNTVPFVGTSNNATISLMNSTLAAMETNLIADGLQVEPVDVNTAIINAGGFTANPPIYQQQNLSSNNTHFYINGHKIIADAVTRVVWSSAATLSAQQVASLHAVQQSENATTGAAKGQCWANAVTLTSATPNTNYPNGFISCPTPTDMPHKYRIGITISVASASSAVLGWSASYTDPNGNSQAPTNLSLTQLGVAAPALTFTISTTGAVYYGEATVDVNASGNPIVVNLTLASGTLNAVVSAYAEKVF